MMTKPRPRTLIYLLIVLCFSVVIHFHQLGERSFYGDEAIYAYVGKNMEISGSWIDFRFHNNDEPYLQKPPLYFWLTALVKPFFEDQELGHRFWAACFGVGCALLTLLLGSALFNREAGLGAALLLTTNQSFLLVHGSRHGTMDSGVTLLVLGAAYLVWVGAAKRRLNRYWFLAGLLTGTICMLKGTPLGLAALGLLGIYSFLYLGRGWARVGPPLLGFLGTVLVAAPWFIFQWIRFGGIIELQHVSRFQGDLHPDHVKGPWYYLEAITQSSIPFHAFLPALALAAILAITFSRCREFGLISCLGTGWIVLISLSASKLLWYAYPAFPFVCLALAGIAVMMLSSLLSKLPGPVIEKVYPTTLAGVFTLMALMATVPLVLVHIPHKAGLYRDLCWEVYNSKAMRETPDARMVVLKEKDDRLDSFRNYYMDHEMEKAQIVESTEALDPIWAQPGPIVVALNRQIHPDWVEALDKRYGSDKGFRFQSYYHVVYARGIEPELPPTIAMQKRPLDSSYPPLGQEILFVSPLAGALLGQGWELSDPGEGSRWSTGKRSELRFRLRQRTALVFSVNMVALGEQHVDIELNGQTLGTLYVDETFSDYSLLLPETLLQAENCLVVACPHARSPRSMGRNNDERLLGVSIRSIRFDEAAPPRQSAKSL